MGGGEITSIELLNSDEIFEKIDKVYISLPRVDAVRKEAKGRGVVKRLQKKREIISDMLRFLVFIWNSFGGKRSTVLVVPTDPIENLIIPIFARLVFRNVKLIVITHGHRRITIEAFRSKPKLYQKFYAMLQYLFYLIIERIADVRLSFIPTSRHEGYTHLPFPFNIRPRLKGKHFDVLFMGRFYEIKGWMDGIKAYMKFIGSLQVRKPKLILAGDGPDRQVAEELAKKFSFIEYQGFVTGDKKESILSRCRVLLLPSRWETFPLVVAEALSHGLVVVSYRGIWIENYTSELRKSIVQATPFNIDDLALKLSFAWKNYRKLKPDSKACGKLYQLINRRTSIETLKSILEKVANNHCG